MPEIPLMMMNRCRFLVCARVAIFAVILCCSSVFAANNTHIVVVPVDNMYSGPSDQADVVS
jgi:hypothetical protein